MNELNELNEQQCNTKYTFWKLLSEYQVEIPIIQRDYAQGRNSAKAIRNELLLMVSRDLQLFIFCTGTLLKKKNVLMMHVQY